MIMTSYLRNTAAALCVGAVGLGVMVSITPSPASAQGVPTVDTKNLLEQMRQLEAMAKDYGIQSEQLTALFEQLDLLEQQLAKLDEMQALLSDPTQIVGLFMGDGLDGLLEGNFSADMVGAIVNGANGDWSGVVGSNASEVVDKINGALASAGTSQSDVKAMAESDNPILRNAASATASNAATSAAAEVAYEEAAASRERVVRLVDEIGELNSLKASVDHNTRVTAELAISMAAMWQLESVQTVNNGMGGVLDAATATAIQKYNDFTLPQY